MSFGEVLDAYQTLRRRIILHAGDSAFTEVAVSLPKGDADELSFLRLVLWSYAVVQESGRVSFKFLQELPPLSALGSGPPLAEASVLRTWATHNLSLGSKSDRSSVAHAYDWFRKACGVAVPIDAEHWRASFQTLCGRLHELLQAAIAACELFDVPQDGKALVTALKLRVDRNWDAYRFDGYLEEAVTALGYKGLDTVAFRKRCLQRWRDVITTATDDGMERLLRLRIESDLVIHLGNALPYSSIEFLERVSLRSPQEVGAFLLLLRLRGASSKDVEDLLRELPNALGRPAADAQVQAERERLPEPS